MLLEVVRQEGAWNWFRGIDTDVLRKVPTKG